MDLIHRLFLRVQEDEREEFLQCLVRQNIERGKLIVRVVILIEAVFCCVNIVTSLQENRPFFHYDVYLAAYLMMIAVSWVFCVYLKKTEARGEGGVKRAASVQRVFMLYCIFMLCWGGIVSLLDQKLYGQLMAYMVNVALCAMFFCLDTRMSLAAFGSSALLVTIGLPFFQRSTNILIGHYINLTVYLLLTFICSRMVYGNCLKEFRNRKLLSQANQRLLHYSYYDELTSLPNRRSYKNYVEAIPSGRNHVSVLYSVIMIDIDHFKKYNDTYGHEAGDLALTRVAAEIGALAREKGAFASRIGGEEFIYISVHTEADEIAGVAETIRRRVEELKIIHSCSQTGFLTVSLGVSTGKVRTRSDLLGFVRQADEALYRAKAAGKNCVAGV